MQLPKRLHSCGEAIMSVPRVLTVPLSRPSGPCGPTSIKRGWMDSFGLGPAAQAAMLCNREVGAEVCDRRGDGRGTDLELRDAGRSTPGQKSLSIHTLLLMFHSAIARRCPSGDGMPQVARPPFCSKPVREFPLRSTRNSADPRGVGFETNSDFPAAAQFRL